MKQLFPLLLLLVLSFNYTNSQRPGGDREKGPIVITGKAIDKDDGLPLEYATLVLQSVNNPDQITGGITDIDGNFIVEITPGKYNISLEYISYKSYKLPNQTLTESKDLGTIKLALDVAQLEAVEVVGEKTTVEVRLDKKIYNIGKDLTNSGATITDALNNVPSVDVDVEGAISLRGNENVRILINGKPSALAGFGSTDALTQLPADAIEKVEVITSPSARYDAEGTAGILNIVLKKEKTLGFNGSVTTTIGFPVNTGISVNSNLRTDKFNLFNTTSYTYRDAPGNAIFDNTYTSGSFDRIVEDREYNRLRKGFNTNLGLEYFLTETSSITGSVFYRKSDNEDETGNTNLRYDGTIIDSETFRLENENEDDQNYQLSLNYVNDLDDEGQKLTADVQYSNGKEDKFSVIEENNTVPNQNLITLENVYEKELTDEYLIQADYVLPIGDAQFEAGYRGTFEETVTDYRLDSLNQDTGLLNINEALTNIFTYHENVNAIYTQYGNKLGKFSFLLGLRLENTQLKGELDSDFDISELEEQLGEDVELNFDKNYLGLFPTLNFIYELAENENLSIGYNRRINRPRGRFVNPFPSRDSRTNIFQGNPDLDPAFSNAFDLGYLKRWDKITLTSSIYYQRETNSFERVQEETGQTTTDGIEIIRTIPINLSTNDRIGAEAGILYSPTKWLRLNSSFNFFQFTTEGIFNDIDYGTTNTSWYGRFSSKISLPAKIDWQTNAFYRGPSQTSQTENGGIFTLSLAFSKDILDDNGTLSFNVSDVLNSRKRTSYTETEFFTSDSEFQYRVRQFTLGFVYRFNQPKEKNRNGRGNGNGTGDEDDDIEG
ncbi:TonB-dependent receptor domain-containing protein [Maribacter sp. Asnod1-A12]|uniref:TonB-dependent receptor domain-containing protein n=1 Tax=Maribacter sp. Asnod1-A12 TaxID=3160576 RepID=UPI00386FAC2F